VGPDRGLLIPEPGSPGRVREVKERIHGLPDGGALVASLSGDEVYAFDADGRHLRTIEAQTGVDRFQFGYDDAGRLVSVTDRSGLVTRIERDGSGGSGDHLDLPHELPELRDGELAGTVRRKSSDTSARAGPAAPLR
jgi:YD repeat-containing protein